MTLPEFITARLNDAARITPVAKILGALRKIVEEHKTVEASSGPQCDACADWLFPCMTLRLIGGIWRHHPDYDRDHWTPEGPPVLLGRPRTWQEIAHEAATMPGEDG